jgi:hypothetical protein
MQRPYICIYIYLYIYVYICIHIYIYIYLYNYVTCANGPSMMMFIHNICMGLRGLGRPMILFKATKLKAATDVLYEKNEFINVYKNIYNIYVYIQIYIRFIHT